MKTKTINMKTNDTELPKWFKGVVYQEGDLVSNPFTGQQAILTPNELAMYDFIKGAEYTISVTFNDDIQHPDVARISNEMRKALDWFKKANARAYLILLD